MNDRSGNFLPPWLVITPGTAAAVDHPRIIDIRRSCPSADVNESDWVLALVTAHIRANRVQIIERQAEGIRAAKARGVYAGRARKLSAEDLTQAHELVATGVPKAEIARKLGVNRSTLHRALQREAAPH